MHDLPLIATIAAAFAAAWVLGLFTQWLRLSPIVGYLLAGVLIGPHTPGFQGDLHLAHQLAEVGVILLMFGVGLHFRLEDLLAVKGIAIPGALGQSLGATAVAVAVFAAFGMGPRTGAVLGMAMAVASTVVLMRVLMDADALNSPAGHVAVGWLLVEDVLTVVVLVVIPVLGGGTGPGGRGVVAPRGRRRGGLAQAGDPRRARDARRRAARPVGAHPGRPTPVPGAVHPDRAGVLGGAGGRGVHPVRGVHGPRGVPGRDDGRPVARQPPGGGRRPAPAGRLRRAVLRLRRDAVRPGVPPPGAADDAGGPRHHPAGQAARRPGHRGGPRVLGPHGPDGGPGADPDRGILLHPVGPGAQARADAGRGAQRAGRRGDPVDHPEPPPVPLPGRDRAVAEAAAAAVGPAQRPGRAAARRGK